MSAVTGTPMPNGTWISSSVQALKFRKDQAFVERSNLENAYYMILSEKRLQRKLYSLSPAVREASVCGTPTVCQIRGCGCYVFGLIIQFSR